MSDFDMNIELDCGCCEGQINEGGSLSTGYMTPVITKTGQKKNSGIETANESLLK